MIKAIIVEDEPHSQELIEKLINRFHPSIKILDKADNVESAALAIESKKPNLIFLDIELKLKSAFDLLEMVDCSDIQIIFTTAFEQYAIKAIRYAAVDYLLKPIDIDELNDAIGRAAKKIEKNSNSLNHIETIIKNLQNPNSRIAIPTIEGFDFIPTEDIVYCQADGGYSIFNLKSNKQIVSSKPLIYYERIVDPTCLLRVSKSYMINISCIKKYVKGKTPYVILANNKSIDISPAQKNRLLELLKNM